MLTSIPMFREVSPMSKEKVWRYIENNSHVAVEWLSKMVSIPSVNNASDWSVDNEKAVQEWIAEKLKDIGLDVDMWAEDEAGVRPNVVGIMKGTGGGRDVMLTGHCDVVPVLQPENWRYPPFSGTVADGMVHGRGATDMKGGLAAELFALSALKECGIKLKGNVLFASTVGEEAGEGGTIGAATVARRGYRPSFAVVAEGTDLDMLAASTGVFMFDFIVRGKSVHGACRNQVIFPQPYGILAGSDVGVDALEKALPFIYMFRRLENEWNQAWKHPVVGSGGSPFYDSQGIGVFCINPCFIDGGTYRASINSYLKITYYVWYPPTKKIDDVIAEIKSNVLIWLNDAWLRQILPKSLLPAIRKPLPAYDTPLDLDAIKVIKQSYQEVMGKDLTISGLKAVCDCAWFNSEGIPSVCLGPGCSFCNHGDNEFIEIDKVIKAAKIYAGFVMDYC